MAEETDSIFAKNLSSLPELKQSEVALHSAYSLEDTRTGKKTYKLDGIYIHSKYDPEKEATRAVQLLLESKEDVDVYILFGCGLGYVIQELYQKILAPNHKQIKPYILWIEQDVISFLTALHCYDMSKLFTDANVKIFIDASKEVIGSFLQTVPTKRIRYYYHRPLYIRHETYFRDIQNYICYVLDRKDMNTATLIRFQKIWARNIIYNTPYYPRAGKIDSLKKIAAGCTAAVVAGGPTLEHMLSFLKQEQENLVIVAVDTAYKYLRSNGITPEIVVSVDPQYWNYKYLEDEPLEDSILVTDPSAYFRVFRDVDPKRIFTGNSLFELTGYFVENYGRGTLAAGGSVATTAFDIARFIGAEKIILAGLDLGFPGKNTHFKGAFFETNFVSTGDYFHSAEQKSFQYLMHTGELPLTKATDGSMIGTDSKMILFRHWIEREIGLTNVPVILPNLGGSLLEGSQIVSPNALPAGKHAAKTMYQERISQLIKQNQNIRLPYLIDEKINTFIKTTQILVKEAGQIVKLIPETGKMDPKKIEELDNRQKQMMNTVEKNKITSIVSSSAQNVLLSIMENVSYSQDSEKSVWIKTRKLYEAIEEMAIFYEKNFQKLLKIIGVLPKIKSDVL